MDNKELLLQDIQGKIIIDILKNKKELIYNDAFNSKRNTIRFSSKFIESIFKSSKILNGYWKNGKRAFYEIHNSIDKILITCSIDYGNLTNSQKQKILKINKSIDTYYDNEILVIKKWVYEVSDINALINDFLNEDMSIFEKEINNIILKNDEEIDYGELSEGDVIRILTTKYERNIDARNECLKHYGYKCQICGFDFEKKFGKKFKNIIEVHHIKPLSDIKENYVVDPINDLIPVCPNCHTVLHSKKDGVYLPREIKELL